MGQPLSTDADRLDGLTSWHADWSALRVVVLGLGEIGFSVADTLAELGAAVTVVAGDAAPQLRELASVIGVGVILADGDEATAAVRDIEPQLVVVSPAYRPGHPALEVARERAVPIWSDLEVAWRLRDKVAAPEAWITVTGVGASRVAELTASMLVAAGRRAAPAGGPGVPVLDAVRDPHGFDALVVAASSRQLHWMPNESARALTPTASLLLHARPDDLAWHGSSAAQREAWGRAYANTRVACVYNLGDSGTRELVAEAEVVDGARAIGVGLGIPGPSDLGIVEGILVDRAFLEERRSHALELSTLDELTEVDLVTRDDVLAVLAAAALARAAGVEPTAVREGIRRRPR